MRQVHRIFIAAIAALLMQAAPAGLAFAQAAQGGDQGGGQEGGMSAANRKPPARRAPAGPRWKCRSFS